MRIPDVPVGLLSKRLLQATFLLCLGFGVAFCEHVARAEDETAGPSATEVRQALSAFAQASKSKDPAECVTAARTPGTLRHESVRSACGIRPEGGSRTRS